MRKELCLHLREIHRSFVSKHPLLQVGELVTFLLLLSLILSLALTHESLFWSWERDDATDWWRPIWPFHFLDEARTSSANWGSWGAGGGSYSGRKPSWATWTFWVSEGPPLFSLPRWVPENLLHVPPSVWANVYCTHHSWTRHCPRDFLEFWHWPCELSTFPILHKKYHNPSEVLNDLTLLGNGMKTRSVYLRWSSPYTVTGWPSQLQVQRFHVQLHLTFIKAA